MKAENTELTKEEAMEFLGVKSWNTMKKLIKEHGVAFRTYPKYYFEKSEIIKLKESLKRVL